jgi:hypothetical protein
LPSYSPVKATQRPSGENFGSLSTPMPVVRRLASPPSRDTDHRSPAYEKTMCVRLTVGLCSRRGLSAADCCASVEAEVRRSAKMDRKILFIGRHSG